MKGKQCIIALVVGLILTLVLLWLTGACASNAARAQGADGHDTYYVALSCTGVPSPCYNSVQAAVDAVDHSDDVIKVAAGTYTGINNRGGLAQVVYISKTVTIRGGYTTTNDFAEPANPDANPSTLDAQRHGRVLYITGNISPTIEGLHITGGDATGLRGGPFENDAGGGVYVITATAIITNCRVFGNTAPGSSPYGNGTGGGVYVITATVNIANNRVFSNTAAHGGGLGFHESAAMVSNNSVFSNSVTSAGGGLYLEMSPVTLSDNLISDNWASSGGGLFLRSSDATVSGNAVASNTAWSGGGGLFLSTSNATLRGNFVFSNTASFVLSCVTGYGAGGGLALHFSNITLSNNMVSSNCAPGSGGGLFLYSSSALLTNDVVVDNWSNTVGSGLGIMASSVRMLHTTIARNYGGDGSGVFTTDADVLGDGNRTYSTVTLTNTVVASHTVGVMVSNGNIVNLEATLWGSGKWANGTDWGGTGAVHTGTVNIRGDPVFAAPGAGDYHIGLCSAAVDMGVDAGVKEDIDGDVRPAGRSFDIGADELITDSECKRIRLPLMLHNHGE
jgi:hypothetical protein